jgi:hypothetical protein
MSTIINKCKYCKSNNNNGIIRNSNFFCDEGCYNKFLGLTFIEKPTPKHMIKKCDYCLYGFDTSRIIGVNYKTLWFCCDEHLNLANPRPKVMVHMGHPFISPHLMPSIVPPMVLHRGYHIGPGMIGYFH